MLKQKVQSLGTNLVSKYLMNSKALNIAKSAGFKLCNLVLQLLIMPILYKDLTLEEFGIFTTIYTLSLSLLNLDFGILNALKNPLQESMEARNQERTNRLFSTGFFFLAAVSVTINVIVFCVYEFSKFNNAGTLNAGKYFNVVLLSVLLFSIRYVVNILNVVFHASKQLFLSDLSQFIANLLVLVFLYLGSRFHFADIYTVTTIIFAMPIIVALFFYFRVNRKGIVAIKPTFFDKAVLKGLVKPSLVFFVLQISWIAISTYIPVLLLKLVDPEVSGKFNLIARLYGSVYIFNTLLMYNLWPHIASSYFKDNKQSLEKYLAVTRYVVLGFACVVLFIMFFSGFILNLWMGTHVAIDNNLVVFAGIYYILLIAVSSNNIFLNALNAFKKQYVFAFLNPVLIAVLVLICWQAGLTHTIAIILPVLIVLLINLIYSYKFIHQSIHSERSNYGT